MPTDKDFDQYLRACTNERIDEVRYQVERERISRMTVIDFTTEAAIRVLPVAVGALAGLYLGRRQRANRLSKAAVAAASMGVAPAGPEWSSDDPAAAAFMGVKPVAKAQ